MRDFKFRAWTLLGNKPEMVYNPVGGLCDGVDDKIYEGQRDGDIWMQYTRMQDRNGREIFEGDIVRVPAGYGGDDFYPEAVCVVEYGAPEYFLWNTKGPHGVVWQDFCWCYLEVIGNKYENPELLEVQP